MNQIDLNCDLGEGAGCDAQLMPLITSANIACGGHAGDADSMRNAVSLAKHYNVNIGAHPSFPDPENFGRREMSLPRGEIKRIVIDQIAALRTICIEQSATLHHVKPHGALYNLAARDMCVALEVAEAILAVDRNLTLVGLAGSKGLAVARDLRLAVAGECFADRTYQIDGSLTPRTQHDALIHDPEMALRQVLRMIRDQQVITQTGEVIAVSAQTVCVHGDGASALSLLKHLRKGLEIAGIQVRPFDRNT